jgi:hypothetical protein
MKFCLAPIDLPTDLSNAIIDDKAEAKKNGISLKNQDIVLRALRLYYNSQVRIAEPAEPTEPAPDINLANTTIKPLYQKFDYEAQGFLTNEQTAKYVGCSEVEVNKAHAEGTLKFTRFGRIQYNKIDDINNWNLERIKQKTA